MTGIAWFVSVGSTIIAALAALIQSMRDPYFREDVTAKLEYGFFRFLSIPAIVIEAVYDFIQMLHGDKDDVVFGT